MPSSLRKAQRHAIQCAVASILVGCLSAQANAETPALTRTVTVNIPPQKVSTALLALSQQAGVQVLMPGGIGDQQSTRGVTGQMSVEEALQKLLEGTSLRFKLAGENAVGIETVRPTTGAYSRGSDYRVVSQLGQPTTARLAQVDVIDHDGAAVKNSNAIPPAMQAIDEASKRIEEVIVTGSHIRGVEDLASPVLRFDRAEIEASGYATTQQFIQSLPQNLNSVSDTTFGTVNGGTGGVSYNGYGINLRGLGSESTLVLLNGRRLSAAGRGNFVDVSLIPLTAIERVEVLTDGASAVYGSDAVGGVVNFVLREDFEGAETRLRYGSVTEGRHDELQAGQLFGRAWGSGQMLVSYEYYRRTPLDGADRDFIQLNPRLPLYDVIPGQKRHGALAVLTQRLSDRIALSADLFASQRETAYYYDIGIPYHVDSEMRQYGGSLGLSVDLSPDWQARLSALADQNDADMDYYDISTDSPDTGYANDSRLLAVDLAADGPIGSVPGGEVRLAIGGQFRNEKFVEKYASYPAQLKRDVMAVYAEMRVPWVGAQNRRTGMERFELTLAGRFEEYSDFGSTFNPKVGLAWVPVGGLNLRGTWSTSFKAPLLSQMNLADNNAQTYPNSFLDGSGGTTPVVAFFGSGVDLQPEESTNWTVGFDLTPAALPQFNLSVTYFDIDYRDRIRTPFPTGYDVTGVLLDPTFAMIVTRNPDPAELTALLSGFRVACRTVDGGFISPCTNPPVNEITAIVDQRLRNLAAVRLSGLDFSMRYRLEHPIGTWGWGLSGQYQLKNREQLTPQAEETNQLNTVWRPVDLRLRHSVSFARGAFNVVAFVNYTDGYADRRASRLVGPLQRATVSSWTTVDLTLQFRLAGRLTRLGLPEASLALNAINVFDRDPPFIGSTRGIYFDGVNADPLGRFISAQLTTHW